MFRKPPTPVPAPPPSPGAIAEEMMAWRDESFKGRVRWSAATHTMTTSIIILSSCASILSQIHPQIMRHSPVLSHLRNADIVSLLTLLVTVFTGVQAKMAFERKWIANRLTRSSIDTLYIDYHDGVPIHDIGERLKKIIEDHNKAITG